MGDMSEDFKFYKEAQKERREKRLPKRTGEIFHLRKLGFVVERKTEWQYRINGVLDIYPLHHRYHDLKNNKRGGFKNITSFVESFFKQEFLGNNAEPIKNYPDYEPDRGI